MVETSTIWGEVNPDGFILSEKARRDLCPKCKKRIWLGICRTGFETALRPEPITPAEDLAFYLEGRRTYKLWKVGERFEFQLRLPSDLKKPTPDIKLAAHRCNDQALADWPNYWPKHIQTFIPLNQEPPF